MCPVKGSDECFVVCREWCGWRAPILYPVSYKPVLSPCLWLKLVCSLDISGKGSTKLHTTLSSRFTGCVKLKGVMLIGGEDEHHPRQMKLWEYLYTCGGLCIIIFFHAQLQESSTIGFWWIGWRAWPDLWTQQAITRSSRVSSKVSQFSISSGQSLFKRLQLYLQSLKV